MPFSRNRIGDLTLLANHVIRNVVRLSDYEFVQDFMDADGALRVLFPARGEPGPDEEFGSDEEYQYVEDLLEELPEFMAGCQVLLVPAALVA